jgi:hypothetical protein
MVLTLTRVNAWQMHRHCRESVYPRACGEYFLFGEAFNALSCYCDLVAAASKCVGKIEYVPLLATNIWRKELGQQQ